MIAQVQVSPMGSQWIHSSTCSLQASL